MSQEYDIRWRQRFENFERALQLYQRVAEIEEPSEAETMGLVQAFEITFELAWKTIKDYAEMQGLTPKSPRESIKQGFQMGILDEGRLWLEALENRNQTVHLYDETKLTQLVPQMRGQYLSMMWQLHHRLTEDQ